MSACERFTFTFRAMQEPEPRPEVAGRVRAATGPAYRQWFPSPRARGRERPTRPSARMLARAHAGLYPVYERLVEALGRRRPRGPDALDLQAAAATSPACTQGVWTRTGHPVLVRNYDYSPSHLEGLDLAQPSPSARRVIADERLASGVRSTGMNEDGLAVSLTFGGRRVLGRRVRDPLLILRYVLETCLNGGRGPQEVLARLPCNLALQRHDGRPLRRRGDRVSPVSGSRAGPIRPVAGRHQPSGLRRLAGAGAQRPARSSASSADVLESFGIVLT